MFLKFVTEPEMQNTIVNLGALLGFIMTFVGLRIFEKILPTDGGREFAVEGNRSIGKPRGAGIIFILVYAYTMILFGIMNFQNLLYLLIIVFCMITGYLDDASRVPWGELKKGILDLAVSLMAVLVYIFHNGTTIHFAIIGVDVTLNPVAFGILGVILVWGSINVTNCCDGVDGLCGTLSIVSIVSIYVLGIRMGKTTEMTPSVIFMVMVLLAYLWYNSTPSRLLMGDAGSRAIGVFIAIEVLITGSPVMYLFLALIILLDGGLGLLKVTLIRLIKVNIMKNLRTPLHDHLRKKSGWSNTQVVNRFMILQVLISLIALGMVK